MDKFKYIVVVSSPHTYATDWVSRHKTYEKALAYAKENSGGKYGHRDYTKATIALITEVFPNVDC